MRERVSVVIPHYGEARPTAELVARLQGQTGSVEVEIIVSDDASPEPFPELQGVIVVRRQNNGGFGAAVNTGVAAASHPMLLVLNSDIAFDEDFVERLTVGARTWMPAVVSTRVDEPWGERCVGRRWPTTRGLVAETLDPLARLHGVAWFERLLGNDVRSWRATTPAPVDWVVGVCLLMPTADFRAVGGLDERFFMNCEEIDLQRRLHEERGLPVILLPEPRIRHVNGGSSESSRRTGWLTDARMRYHEKWRGGPALYLGLLASAGINLVWNTARSRIRADVDAWAKFRGETARYQHAWRTRR